MGLISRREFFNVCGLAGVVAVMGGTALLSGCTQNEAGAEGTYTVTVVSGATLEETDTKTGTYKYKRKCEACDWEDKSSKTVKGKSVSETFTCPQCKFKQNVVINVSKAEK